MGEKTIRTDGAGAPGATDSPVFDALVEMTLNAFERSRLDPETYLLTRIAALVATGASPASYLLNLGAADEIGVPLEKIQGTLVAIAPVVGSARVVTAARGIGEVLGVSLLPGGGDEEGVR
ncbi:4-carboxymuconolactone decarboxylase [Streptomyces sp. SAI-208]|uniref:carboxymuconolactone decarboxylase family protein n=1 Tax=unclassified Streptomyces TaxID=2593676 RepID=UPI002475E5A6|nr:MULTISPECIES: carboxymuconolactone decarboxylase family protein [unclassified Streptomyces]MDH6517662.1 4-carboxymuconolactone decarboxylase [Streptomyces sp. SAI-090]MDH6549885.1 4-carboxymuconolactone decarboxylase [Streptomyces sp. SAI-041]MDH6568937.1 4-carboxymuconolactone decarboxylase [Streptomyces sp. SAI-117]MDH6586109.1 4-carboxymuconolactone decarboxylase [Streptomyces sp. SAI-133]MDH6608522.1 4-carboxymuconolactone decarboxylase [Streptomyces sp. SAI-208]